MIPAYNCATFLPGTLHSVLQQDMGEADMQIEVVDDCSTDANVQAIVNKIGHGRIGYFCQPANVGSLRNFATCLSRSKGELVHLLHGDDTVRVGFYNKIRELFSRFPEAGAAYTRFAYMNEANSFLWNHEAEAKSDGIVPNFLERIAERQRIQYVSMVVKREVYETLGGFFGAEYGEDWEMWARIAAHYPVAYSPEILADYRKHRASISGKSFLTGRNMKELEWAMRQISTYLPKEKESAIIGKSKKFYAHYALRIANGLWADLKNKDGAKAQAKAAWNMQADPALLYKIIKLYTRMTLNI